MGTSTIPYDIRLWLFPGANPSADSSLWGLPWDVSSKIRHAGSDGGQEITYQSGRLNEGGQVDAGSCSLSLDNRLGWFSTQNAAGPKYGLISKNTPALLSMLTGYDSFGRTGSSIGTADSGQSWTASKAFWSTDGRLIASGITTPNDASLLTLVGSGASDYDIQFTATPSAAITGDFFTIAALQNGSTGYMVFCAEFKPGGVLTANIRRFGTAGGTTSVASVDAPFSWTVNQAVMVRARRIGASVMMKVWRPAVESEPGTWTSIGTETYVVAGGDLGLFVWRSASNTNGTYTMYVDDLTILGFEVIGTVVQWPTNWDRTGNNCWAPIQIAGVLRRLQQGKGSLKSPLYRQLPSYGPTGYWPLEDEASATRFGSAVPGGVAASFQGVTPAGDSTLAGGASAPTLSDTAGFIRGTTAKKQQFNPGVNGFAAMFFIKLSSLPAAKTAMFTWTTTGTPTMPTRWVTSINTTTSWVEGFDADGNLVTSATNLLATNMDFTGWVAWQLEMSLVGTTTFWSSIYHGVGLADYNSQTGAFTTSAVYAQCTGFVAGSSNLPTGTAFAHVWIGPNSLPFVTNTFSLVSSGYLGETAGARIARMCAEEGIPCVVEPGTTVALGVQPQSTTLAAVRLAADTDLGILYERGSGLGYRPLSARYQQAVTFNLSKASGHIADVPAPIDDDQRYRNQFTVSRDGGSFAVARAPQSEIDLNGLYDDSATLNLPDDSTLDDHAGFRLFLARQASFRWPDLGINLSRNPSLVSTWRARAYGPRVRATLNLLQMTGADPDVIAEGYTARLTPLWWSISMSCTDARPFDIPTLNDSINSRLDADNSTVNAGFLAADTSFVATNNGDPYSSWAPTSTWPAEVPFFIKVSGEIMTVTNVGNVAGNVQTLTVTRGINGFTKDHAAGEQVTLAYPVYVAL